MGQDIIILLIGLVVLVSGGELLVRGASSIALRMQISPLVVGLTIVAFGTSAPELFISIQSALGGSPDIAMGNVVGSNICNLALVLGITAVIYPVRVQRDSIRIDWPVTMSSSLLLFLLVQDRWIGAGEGILFIFALFTYTFFIIRKSQKETIANLKLMEDDELPTQPSASVWKDVLFIIVGTIGLSFGSDWFVSGAQSIAIDLGVSERVVGLTVVAIGTSLPELMTSGIAAYKKETDIAVGNLLGSNIFNILSILGFTSIVHEIQVSDTIVTTDIIWMLAVTLVIFPMMLTRKTIGRIEGSILLLIYGYYIYSVVI